MEISKECFMPNCNLGQIYKIMYKYLKHFLSKLGVKNLYLRWAKVFSKFRSYWVKHKCHIYAGSKNYRYIANNLCFLFTLFWRYILSLR